jgi:hypothetical protein
VASKKNHGNGSFVSIGTTLVDNNFSRGALLDAMSEKDFNKLTRVAKAKTKFRKKLKIVYDQFDAADELKRANSRTSYTNLIKRRGTTFKFAIAATQDSAFEKCANAITSAVDRNDIDVLFKYQGNTNTVTVERGDLGYWKATKTETKFLYDLVTFAPDSDEDTERKLRVAVLKIPKVGHTMHGMQTLADVLDEKPDLIVGSFGVRPIVDGTTAQGQNLVAELSDAVADAMQTEQYSLTAAFGPGGFRKRIAAFRRGVSTKSVELQSTETVGNCIELVQSSIGFDGSEGFSPELAAWSIRS